MARPKKDEFIKQIQKQISLRDRVSQRREPRRAYRGVFLLMGDGGVFL